MRYSHQQQRHQFTKAVTTLTPVLIEFHTCCWYIRTLQDVRVKSTRDQTYTQTISFSRTMTTVTLRTCRWYHILVETKVSKISAICGYILFRFWQRSRPERQRRPQAASQSHNVLVRAARSARKVVRTDTLPGHLHARRNCTANAFIWSESTSVVQQSTSALEETSEQWTATADVTHVARRVSGVSVANEQSGCTATNTSVAAAHSCTHSATSIPSPTTSLSISTTFTSAATTVTREQWI